MSSPRHFASARRQGLGDRCDRAENRCRAERPRALSGRGFGPRRGLGCTDLHGEVFVDCLFGSGLARPLSADHAALLARLAASHRHTIAIDVPSGVAADSGLLLSQGLPQFALTISLGAWKFAHFLMPASATMGALRLVGIGVEAVAGAASLIGQATTSPRLLPMRTNTGAGCWGSSAGRCRGRLCWQPRRRRGPGRAM